MLRSFHPVLAWSPPSVVGFAAGLAGEGHRSAEGGHPGPPPDQSG